MVKTLFPYALSKMPSADKMEMNGELTHCVTRVTELPVVAAVVGGVRGVYEKVKNTPVPLVRRTLNAAEATAKYAANQAYPYAIKFEKQIGYLDSLACKGLDVIEGSVPAVKKAPEEILADAKAYFAQKAQPTVNAVSSVKTYGADKVGAAAEYGKDKIIQAAYNPLAQRALQNLDAVLIVADAYVDKYIPAEEFQEASDEFEKNEENWDPALAPIAHAAALTSKIRRRIFNITVGMAKAAKQKCADAVGRNIPADYVEYVRSQLNSGSVALRDKTNAIWKETASLTPSKAAQAVTESVNAVEARSYAAAQKLLAYLSFNYYSATEQAAST